MVRWISKHVNECLEDSLFVYVFLMVFEMSLNEGLSHPGDTWMSLEDNYCGYLKTEPSVSMLGSILRQKNKETLFPCVLPKPAYCECRASSKQTGKYLIVHSEHCCCSVPQSCLTMCDPMDCSMPASLPFAVSQSVLTLMSIESVIQCLPSKHLILCHPILLLPSIFLRTI